MDPPILIGRKNHGHILRLLILGEVIINITTTTIAITDPAVLIDTIITTAGKTPDTLTEALITSTVITITVTKDTRIELVSKII